MSNEIISIAIDTTTERLIFDDLYSIALKNNNINTIPGIDIDLLNSKLNYDNINNRLANIKVNKKD